jgi:colicin import membrane protein
MPVALRYYGLPLLLALVVHLLAVAALYSGWNPSKDVRLIKPQIVHAQLLVLQPKAPPRRRPPPRVEEAQPLREEVKPEPEPREQVEEPPKVDLEAQQRQREREEQQRRLAELAEASFAQALEFESTELAKGDDQAVAQSYQLGIYQLVVANWSRPPSARNGMQALLMVELVPTGDVVAVTIVESSGNSAFDRSAEAAVRKSRSFDVPTQADVFERYFRRFSLLFRPEDLLR